VFFGYLTEQINAEEFDMAVGWKIDETDGNGA
jgi:hypothetical protein